MKCKIIVLPVVIALSITTVAHAQLHSIGADSNHNEWSVKKVLPYVNEDEDTPAKRISAYVEKALESLSNARMRIKGVHGSKHRYRQSYQGVMIPLGTKPK